MMAITYGSAKPLLAPIPGPSEGAIRESLNSLLKRICEHNQLTVNDVLSAYVVPALGVSEERRLKMGAAVHLFSRGRNVSRVLNEQIQGVTVLKGLSSLTLQELVSLRGIGQLKISTTRKWCPTCLSGDLDTTWGPYERLLWCIHDVWACPIHRCKLHIACPSCGRTGLTPLSGRDLPGRCPNCFGWLGGNAIPLDADTDGHSRYLLWVAKSFSDLLDSPMPANMDVGPNFRKVVLALAERHFDGVAGRLGAALSRQKSVVSYWLSGKASPSWPSVCEFSFVFQVPIPDIFVSGP